MSADQKTGTDLTFWDRVQSGNRLPDTTEGPLYEASSNLERSLNGLRNQLELKTYEDEEIVSSKVATFSSDRGRLTHEAAAFTKTNKKDHAVYIAITSRAAHADSSDTDFATYLLSPDGVPTKLDSPDWEFDSKSTDGGLLVEAINAISKDLENIKVNRDEKRQRRSTITRRAFLGTALGLGIAAGVGYAGKRWILDPHAREEAAREAYDNRGEEIGGEGVSVERAPLFTMSVEDFAQIPEYEDGDGLVHARTFELKDGRTSVTIKGMTLTDDQELIAAVSNTSLLRGGAFHVNQSRDEMQILLDDIDSYRAQQGAEEHIAFQIQARQAR